MGSCTVAPGFKWYNMATCTSFGRSIIAEDNIILEMCGISNESFTVCIVRTCTPVRLIAGAK